MKPHSDLRVTLGIEDIPKKWYNIAADFPEKLPPPLHPGTKEPASFDDFRAIFPDEIIRQEMSEERYIAIPEEVRESLILLNRPSPLVRAIHLEKGSRHPQRYSSNAKTSALQAATNPIPLSPRPITT